MINYNQNKIPSVNQILSQKGKQTEGTLSLNKACNTAIIYFITCYMKDTQIPITVGIFKLLHTILICKLSTFYLGEIHLEQLPTVRIIL